MVGHGGLSVSISINGGNGRRSLCEYDAPDEEPGKRSGGLKKLLNYGAVRRGDFVDITDIAYKVKYIEAALGKRFSFRFKKDPGFQRGCHHLGIQWQIDGNNSNIHHEEIDSKQPDTAWIAECDGIYSGVLKHFFKFGQAQNVDNARSQDEITQSYGTLRVFVYKMNKSPGQSYHGGLAVPARPTFEDPEEALKGKNLPLSVHFDVERASTPPLLAQPVDDFQDKRQLPFAVFEFRYNSTDGLMQRGIAPHPPSFDGTKSRFKDDEEEDDDVILVKSIARQSPLPRSTPTKRRRQDTAGQSEAKFYTETIQSDGTVVIEIDSDNDADIKITKISSVAKPSPKLPFQDPDGVSGSNDQPYVKRRKQLRTEAKAHIFGKSKKVKDEQVHQSSRRGPDRRVRCQTVEDEGTPDCTDNTVVRRYQIHPQFMDISESKDAEVDSQSSASTLA